MPQPTWPRSPSALHLTSSGAGTPKINSTVTALRFFFDVTLDRADIAKHLSFVYEPRKLPIVLSPEVVGIINPPDDRDAGVRE